MKKNPFNFSETEFHSKYFGLLWVNCSEWMRHSGSSLASTLSEVLKVKVEERRLVTWSLRITRCDWLLCLCYLTEISRVLSSRWSRTGACGTPSRVSQALEFGALEFGAEQLWGEASLVDLAPALPPPLGAKDPLFLFLRQAYVT